MCDCFGWFWIKFRTSSQHWSFSAVFATCDHDFGGEVISTSSCAQTVGPVRILLDQRFWAGLGDLVALPLFPLSICEAIRAITKAMLGIFISFLLATSARAIWPKPRLVQKLDTLGEGKLVDVTRCKVLPSFSNDHESPRTVLTAVRTRVFATFSLRNGTTRIVLNPNTYSTLPELQRITTCSTAFSLAALFRWP